MRIFSKFIRRIAILLALFLAANVSQADSAKFLNDLDKKICNSIKVDFVWRAMIFLPADAKNSADKNRRASEISAYVYDKLFMKMPHIFPFLERSELEGEFMKFADKLSEDIVVVAFQYLNQENGKMQKGNQNAMLCIFRFRDVKPIACFPIPTQCTKWKGDKKINSLTAALNRVSPFNQILDPSLNQISGYLNFTNGLKWSMFRGEDALYFTFNNGDNKSSFILKMDLKTYRLMEFYRWQFNKNS